MYCKKRIDLKNWVDWPKAINKAIHEFIDEFTFKPTILLANEYTFSQFDFLTTINPAEKNNIQPTVHEPLENIKLSGFSNFEIELDFAVNSEIPDKILYLIYDDEQKWGNDNTDPIDDNYSKTKLKNSAQQWL